MTLCGDSLETMAQKKESEEGNAVVSPFHDPARWIGQNENAFAIRDAYPLSDGHTLVVPRRAMTSKAELSEAELLACFQLIERIKTELAAEKGAEGFNVGVNEGKMAGQTVDQLHFHVIPRYHGDVADPVGGIRNIFPGQGDYLTAEKKG